MINIYNVVYLFIFAPLIVALFEILVKILQKKPIRWLFFGLNAISSAFCLFLSSLSAQWYLTYAPRVLEDNSAIYLIKNILIYFGFYVDGLSIIFASFSALVFFLVNISSFRFMQENPQGYARFYIYLNLLQFFTIGFILSSNLVQSTIFSIFLGLCVYLFSNFYFQKPAAQRYSKYVFQINVISEIFLLSAMTVFLYFGTNAIDTITTPTLGYNNINSMGLYSCAGLNPFLFGFMTILLIASALIKSAQVPFSSKVHFVSNAPNPAYSAIIVPIIMGEGFYLILRCAPLINLAPISFEIIKITGLISAILGALIAFKENEIKKIFAFLTVSQLGIAGILIGFKLFSAAVFYMVSSSICILLLSLICDAINYATLGQESIKFLGGLRKKLPNLAFGFIFGAISLSGFVFGTFESKNSAFLALQAQEEYFYISILILMGALTAFLLFRLYFRIFEGEYKGSVEIIKPSRLMYFSLFILAFCIPCFWILAKGRIENFLALQENFKMAELNPFLPLFTVVSSLLGYYIAYKIYFKHDFHSIRIKVVRSLFRRRFGLDYFIKFLLEDFIVFVGSIFAFVEKYVLEFFYKLPKYLLRTVSHLFSDGGQK